MSYLDYKFSMGPVVGPAGDPPFDGLIMAAMRRADTGNLAVLQAMWPLVWAECLARYEQPLGLLPDDPDALFAKVASEHDVDVDELRARVNARAVRRVVDEIREDL